MDKADKSTSNISCQICNLDQPKYTCPRCSIPYCSVDCYKSTSHLDCSEEFYKECVETEMKNAIDPEDREKMMEILKRVHEQDENFDPLDENDEDSEGSYGPIDSDDDDEIPDLADRIKNVDLNNADELWAALTDTERQEFEAILKNEEGDKLLVEWVPWWSKFSEIKLVEVVDETEKNNIPENCPSIIEIPSISSLQKASPIIPFNLLNVLHAYVCTVLHYNGEHHNSPINPVLIFLELSENMMINKVFENSESAVESVLEKALEHELLAGEEDKEAITTAVKQIIRGPDDNQQSFYLLAALSDLHNLLMKAEQEYSKEKSPASTVHFPKKFQSRLSEKHSELSKKKFKLYLKKIEYYLAWAQKFSKQMIELEINMPTS